MANLSVTRATQILMMVQKKIEMTVTGKWLPGVEKL